MRNAVASVKIQWTPGETEAYMRSFRRRVLNRFGAFVRSDARQSMRAYVSSPSAPGSPPKTRLGLLRTFLLFERNQESTRVIIGPKFLPGRRAGSPTRRGPQLHEIGGLGRPSFTLANRGIRKLQLFPERPYMEPAFRKNLKELPRIMRQVR